MRKIEKTLTVRLVRAFESAGVRRVGRRSHNPRIVGLPGAGALYVTAAMRANPLGMAFREARQMNLDSRKYGGWVATLHESERLGWVVTIQLEDFADLMGKLEKSLTEKGTEA